MVTMLTFNAESQGLADFQLKDLDDTQRRSMFQDSFDEDLRIAASQHYEAEQNSRRTRKPDAVLERIERQREDETFTPPDEAFNHIHSLAIQCPTYKERKDHAKTARWSTTKSPSTASRASMPPDVRDRPAHAEAARPPVPDFEPGTRGRWRWSRQDGDWAWEQNYDPNEQNIYSPNFRPDDGLLRDWMGRGWIDWTIRFGFRFW